MEELLMLLAALVGLAIVILPFVTAGLVAGARRRITTLEAEGDKRERELRYLYERFRELEKKLAMTAPTHGLHEPAPASEPAAPATIPPAPALPKEPPPIAEAPPQPEPPGTTAPHVEKPRSVPPTQRAKTLPPRPPPPPLEQRVGTWFARLGAGALLIATLFFFKYAVDNDWIGPTGRVLIGMLVGTAGLIGAEALKKTTRPAFVHSVVGLGVACLLISIYASSAFYQLIQAETAFLGNALVLVVGAALAFRHRGEAVLVLVLLAAFANPVLLSTGVDRPFALFSYLLAITGLTLLLSARLGFRVAMVIAVAGVLILFAGWYDRYFEVFDHRGSSAVDLPPEQLVGAYLELATRVVPLSFVGLFTAEWVAVGLWLRNQASQASFALLPVLAGLLFAHAGAAALLYDQPLALGAAMIVAGAAAIATLGRIDRNDLLLIPMVAAFLALSGRIGETPSSQQLWLLGLLGLWSTLYVGTFLRSASRAVETIEAGTAVRAAAALTLMAVLAAILLLPAHRTLAFAVVLNLVSLAMAAVAARSRLPLLVTGALAASALGLGIAAAVTRDTGEPIDAAFLGLLLLWAILYGAAMTRLALIGEPFGWTELLTLAMASLGFVLLGVAATSDDVPTCRALIAAGAGAADLGLAQLFLSRRPDLRSHAAVLAALSLGLFAAAAGFALSGASITLAWAVLTLAAALIFARAEEPIWAVALTVLATATALRALTVDVAEAQATLDLWRTSGGRMGDYRLDPWLNARSGALVATALAFLASGVVLGRALGKGAMAKLEDSRRVAAGLLIAAGWTFLVGAGISEVHNAVLDLPAPPTVYLDFAEMSAFYETVLEAERAQRGKLAMTSTVLLASFAMLILAIGFAAKDGFHRYLGLGLFLLTVGKLAAWDVWNLARTYQIIVFAVVGALLLGSGFLYARLKAFFSSGRATTVLLVLLGLGAPAFPPWEVSAAAPKPAIERYRSVRSLGGVSATGEYRLQVDLDLFRASTASQLLTDLLLVGPSGKPAPHFVRAIAPRVEEVTRHGTIFDPSILPGGGGRATFEVPSGPPHCEAHLEISAPGPFLRRTTVETGDSANTVTQVAEGGLVYTLVRGESVEVTRHTIRYPASAAAWVRITVAPGSDQAPVELRGATFAACRDQVTRVRDHLPLTIVSTRREETERRTIVELDAGAEGVPVDQLLLSVAAPAEFVRRVSVRASSYKSAWPEVGSTVIHRVNSQDTVLEGLELPISLARKRWFQLVVEDHDDEPLAIQGVTGELAAHEVVFRAEQAGDYRLYVGDPRGVAPRYDLEAVLGRRTDAPPFLDATLGPLEANPAFGQAPTSDDQPFTERHRLEIGGALGALLLVLSGWAVRLLRS